MSRHFHNISSHLKALFISPNSPPHHHFISCTTSDQSIQIQVTIYSILKVNTTRYKPMPPPFSHPRSYSDSTLLKAMKPLLPTLPLLILVAIRCTLTLGQAPAGAPGPAPAGPTNVTAILEKAGRFTTFIRLLQNTKVADQINTQLNSSKQGVTIFAPTDASFSGLKAGTLNSFTDEQKVELMQFHVLPSVFSPSQFQTASNPMRTQAGGSQGSYPLNVTASGSQLNVTTGVTNATVANTVYSDSQLAIYEVDHVLLPLSFFTSPTPSPAPSPGKAAPALDSPAGSGATPDSSHANVITTKLLVSAILFLAAFA